MINLNDEAIKYMEKLGFRDIVIDVITYKTWCSPPTREMSVGFTDKEESFYRDQNYIVDESVMGKVYYPSVGAMQTGDIGVCYEVKPWMSAFRIDGLRALPALRLGMGTKSPKYFVELLSNIYPKAFDEYRENKVENGKFDVPVFFDNVNTWFMDKASDSLKRMYIGFVENMWREGNDKMLRIAGNLVEILADDEEMKLLLQEGITEEFAKSDMIKKALKLEK